MKGGKDELSDLRAPLQLSDGSARPHIRWRAMPKVLELDRAASGRVHKSYSTKYHDAMSKGLGCPRPPDKNLAD